MLLEFEKKVAGFIKANGLFGSADKILLAVSGGADSTALMHAMCAIKAKNVLNSDILCAHINHRLRGSDGDGDEAFVIAQADKLNLAVTTRRLDVRGFAYKNKLSIETAARKLRIESLLDIAEANNCNCVATAHQKDDNAETVVHRLVRGTGFRGLGGIWPLRYFADGIGFVRPLLCVRRDEIVEYLREWNLKWRVDHTNADCTYRRNFIRHQLLPALQQQCAGSIVEQLSELAQSAQKFYSLVCSEAEKVWPRMAEVSGEKVTLSLKSFLAQPQPVKVELVRRSLTHLGSGERDLTHQHYERILQLAQQNTSGRKIDLPDGFIVWREYGNLIFTQAKGTLKPEEQVSKSKKVKVPSQTKFGGYLIEAAVLETDKANVERFKVEKNEFVEWFDLDKVKPPLAVRSRETGDRFWPLGLTREKRVGKFLTAVKVPQEVRKKVLIVADAEKIIWVWPIRISEQAKVTSETRKILQLRITDTKLAD
jgi:tRNA(Ile)-lysidine synthase